MILKKLKLGSYFLIAIFLTLGLSISLQSVSAVLLETWGTSIHLGNLTQTYNLGQNQNLIFGELGNGSSNNASFILFQINAVDKFRVDHNGNVTAAGTIESKSGFKFPDGTVQITAGGGGGGAGTLSQTLTAGNNAGGLNMVNLGSVGIGTPNPGYKLDVSGGDINVSGVYQKSGQPGVSLSCLGGQTPSAITISGGIITFAGACIPIGGSSGPWNTSGPIVYYNGGSVVIGTSLPSTKLTIYDAVSGPIITDQGPDSNYRGLKIADLNNNEKWFIGNNSSNNFVIRRAGVSDDIAIDSSGKVGIAALPESGFNVVVGGKVKISNSLVIDTYSIDRDPNGGAFGLGLGVVGGNWIVSNGKLLVNGNVGIGTNNPSAKLEVAGQIKITGGNPGAGNVLVSDASGLAHWGAQESPWPWYYDNVSGNLSYYRVGNVGIGTALPGSSLGVAGNASVGVNYGVIAAPVSGMIIEGNVGIGTANPGAKLEVSGQVKITGGNPGVGKLLMSDPNGLASWVSPNSYLNSGMNAVISVRKPDNSGTCTITVSNGLIAATDCPQSSPF